MGDEAEAWIEPLTRGSVRLRNPGKPPADVQRPPDRFSEDVDQARAAGVAIEFERAAPLVVDRSLYRELARLAIARTVTCERRSLSRVGSRRPVGLLDRQWG